MKYQTRKFEIEATQYLPAEKLPPGVKLGNLGVGSPEAYCLTAKGNVVRVDAGDFVIKEPTGQIPQYPADPKSPEVQAAMEDSFCYPCPEDIFRAKYILAEAGVPACQTLTFEGPAITPIPSLMDEPLNLEIIQGGTAELNQDQLERLGRLARGWDAESFGDIELALEKILNEMGFDTWGKPLRDLEPDPSEGPSGMFAAP